MAPLYLSGTLFLRILIVASVLLVSTGIADAAVWRVIYELDGTRFEVRDTPFGAGDGSYEVGPGYVTIDYTASGNALVDGPVQLRGFSLVLDFLADNAGASVRSDLLSVANFTGQQTAAAGSLSNGVLTWSESFPYKVTGTITCNGIFCGFAGFEEGVPRDESGEDSVTFTNFTFESGGPQAGAPFVAAELSLDAGGGASTFLLIQGREVRRSLVEPQAPDACINFPIYGAHAADRDCNGAFQLNELLRVVQLFNSLQYSCELGTEDSYDVGPGNTSACLPHTADFSEPFFRIDLSELLRTIQLFNVGGFAPCASQKDGDEGFCAE
jgi:hypothetical protein